MLIVDDLIKYYEENSGLYGLVYKKSRWSRLGWGLFWISFLITLISSFLYLWFDEINLEAKTIIYGSWIFYFCFSSLIWLWSASVLKDMLVEIFRKNSSKKLKRLKFYELFKKIGFKFLNFRKVLYNKSKAVKLIECWEMSNYLEEENLFAHKKVEKLIEFIDKRKGEAKHVHFSLTKLLTPFISIVLALLFKLGILVATELGATVSIKVLVFIKLAIIASSLLILINIFTIADESTTINDLLRILEDFYFRLLNEE